jgi:hypothetical protein
MHHAAPIVVVVVVVEIRRTRRRSRTLVVVKQIRFCRKNIFLCCGRFLGIYDTAL